jgi:hypothetical protein
MTRPLFYKSSSELAAMIERNRANRAELELVLSELRHRDAPTSKRLEGLAKLYLTHLTVTQTVTKHQNPAAPTSKAVIPKTNPNAASRSTTHKVTLSTRHAGGPASAARALKEETMLVDAQPEPLRNVATEEQRRWTDEAIFSLRKKLIDLSKKNPLINFRHSSRGSSHLRLVDERPDLIYGHLVEGSVGFEPLPGEEVTPPDEQTAQFRIAYERARLTDEEFLETTQKLGEDESEARALQEAERRLRTKVREQLGLPPINYGKTLDLKALARAHGFDPSFDLKNSDEEDTEAHHEDDKVRVLLIAKELDKRLKTVWERYRSHERETGLHTLFLVLGFVQWYEDDISDVALHAPLLLLPVHLERKVRTGRYEYRLSGTGEGLQVNIALVEKLRQLGLELPALRKDETPESYFIRSELLLEKGRRLTLRRFATLAVLPFPRMVLWKDLDPEIWPEGAFADHPLLPVLVSAKGTDGQAVMGDTLNIDDPEIAKKAPPLIQPADASQHSALIDIVEGKSVAIEGPPGTGKSQTITNMIAAAVRNGKRVLFVAEKQAALKVVADRLRHAGLGPLLLELHSDSTDRSAFYDSLRHRLAARVKVDEAALELARQELNQQRGLLRRYLALIETRIGARGKTAHWLAWRQIHLQHRVLRESRDAILGKWEPKEPSSLTESQIKDARTRLETFATAFDAVNLGASEGRRTRWCDATHLDPFNQQEQLSAARVAAEAAAELGFVSDAICSLARLKLPVVGEKLDEAAAQIEDFSSFGTVAEHVAVSALRNPDGARAILARQARWRQICARLDGDLADPRAVSIEATNTLSSALAELDEIPETGEVLAAKHNRLQDAVRDEAELGEMRSALLETLSLPEAMTLKDLQQIAENLVRLDQQPAEAKALYQAPLLDELNVVAIRDQRQLAETLLQSRRELAVEVAEACFEREPGELERMSSTYENIGLFGRIFSGEYRSARREVSRLIANQRATRLKVADVLRGVARNIRQSRAFQLESSAGTIFPVPLWRGVDSDWNALTLAIEALQSASTELNGGNREKALMRFLDLPQRDRAKVANSAKALLSHLSSINTLGLGPVTVGDLADRLKEAEGAYARVRQVLGDLNATDSAVIVRNGESLADRLSAMHAAAADFAQLAAGDTLEWVGAIGAPLDELARALEHRDGLLAIPGPIELWDCLAGAPAPVAMLDDVLALRSRYLRAITGWKSAQERLFRSTGISAENLVPGLSNWNDLAIELALLAQDEGGVRLAADLLRYRNALNEVSCSELADGALNGLIKSQELADCFELATVQGTLQEFLGGNGSELATLGGLTLQHARDAFVRIDKELHELEAKMILGVRLRDKPPYGVDNGPKSGWTQLALLESEISLKRPRTPLRDITARAGAALQILKPIWMMSPTSAAQYIQPGTLSFDLLVVDEASQMRPEFAVSAILRGNQFIVVGDPNQLPPTDFFAASDDDDDAAVDDDGRPIETMKVDTESILDLANTRFQHRRRLKWHYRSQHEGLIQFSNRQFYDRDLIVFPSPTTDDDLLGVKNVYVGGRYEASINEVEAKAVIEEAFRLMRSYPERSIGIATMNAKQTELIRNEFDRLILEAPEVRSYIDNYAGTIDEFFIKNLENVQGDERDIILISTVYGPDKNGVVMQRFGPMNREVGWRRLNVLVTRAKLSTRIFTSLRPEDIKVTPSSSRGLIAFKSYLTYAANGAQHEDASGGAPDSDFEIFVADAIRSAGYEVVPQVGVEGFRIDMGVRHPHYPIGFIAGVECDGASYHSGLTIRDRDRIRQTVLEQMGWNIYRVWSTDWFADPLREMAKLITSLEAWRKDLTAQYETRPVENMTAEDVSSPLKDEGASEQQDRGLQTPVDVREIGLNQKSGNEEKTPSGRPMRSLDDIDWYEVRKAQLYEVWIGNQFAGTVEVLSRAAAAPHVYGGTVRVARSEYEGRVKANGNRFIMHDIYATVRQVARLARETMAERDASLAGLRT